MYDRWKAYERVAARITETLTSVHRVVSRGMLADAMAECNEAWKV